MTKEKIRDYSLSVANILSAKKGQDVLVIDVEDVTPLFDFLVIASADSNLHLKALTKFVEEKMAELKIKKLNPIVSSPESQWILIDCGFLVIHLFEQEAREFYSLEKLWAEGTVVYDSSQSNEKAFI